MPPKQGRASGRSRGNYIHPHQKCQVLFRSIICYMRNMESDLTSEQDTTSRFEKRIFKVAKVFTAVFLAVGLAIVVSDVLLLIFAGILLSIFLTSLAEWLSKLSPLPYGWSVAVVCLVLTSSLALIGWWAAPSLAEQFDELTRSIPKSIEKIQSQIQQYSWAEPLLKDARPEQLVEHGRDALSKATGILSGFLGALANFVIIVFIGLYGASEPGIYTRGLVQLFPIGRRPRVEEVLTETKETLKWWLIGKFISMAIIGVLTVVGLWLMDVPLAFILGLIAALFTFIPNIGPIIAAVPAILLGLMESPTHALYIALLYIGIQSVESYLITPLIQRRTINLPPGLTLATQVVLGVMFGGLGVALATPLTAVALVGTKRFYIEDTLGDHTAKAEKDQD
jgi:predicted PurR-regulated permease PerM